MPLEMGSERNHEPHQKHERDTGPIEGAGFSFRMLFGISPLKEKGD
jgi:hypothetical protein